MRLNYYSKFHLIVLMINECSIIFRYEGNRTYSLVIISIFGFALASAKGPDHGGPVLDSIRKEVVDLYYLFHEGFLPLLDLLAAIGF